MKIIAITLLMFLAGCAYNDGLKNQKNVTPIPQGEAPAQPSPSLAPNTGGNAGTVQAAKMLSPVVK